MKIVFLCLSAFALNAFAGDATVTLVRGTAKAFGKELVKGQLLTEGTEVSVEGAKSALQVKLADGSRVLVKEGAFKLEPSSKQQKSIVRLLRGVLYTQKVKSMSELEVVTKNATLGVRGTKFFVQENDQETYLCVCEGLVRISNKKSSADVGVREDATVRAGQRFAKTKANDVMWDLAQQGFKEMVE